MNGRSILETIFKRTPRAAKHAAAPGSAGPGPLGMPWYTPGTWPRSTRVDSGLPVRALGQFHQKMFLGFELCEFDKAEKRQKNKSSDVRSRGSSRPAAGAGMMIHACKLRSGELLAVRFARVGACGARFTDIFCSRSFRRVVKKTK